MNRRNFVRNTALVAGVITLLPAVGSLQSRLEGRLHPLFIDLGRIRIHDILKSPSAMPYLMRRVKDNLLGMQTIALGDSQAIFRPKQWDDFSRQAIHISHSSMIHSKADLWYDEVLLHHAIHSLRLKIQPIYVSLSNTEIAHSNPQKYLQLLHKLDKQIAGQLDRWVADGQEVHIFSSGGRNMHANDLGGYDHSAEDEHACRIFHFYTKTT